MINPSDLRNFVETARMLHLSRAAERLGMSQPALTHCIQRMEHQLGQSLFVRSKKGVTLTPAGKRLFEEAQGLQEHWSRVVESVNESVQVVGGRVRLGCHTAVGQYTLPKFLPQLMAKYPKLQISLAHGLSRHMTEDVISGRLDLALVVNPVRHPDLVIQEVCRDRVTLWKSPQCENKKLLLVDPNLTQSQTVFKKLGQAGWKFDQVIESSSLEVMAQLMWAGTGYALLPERVVQVVGTLKPEAGAPVVEDRICLIYLPEFKKSKTGQAFSEGIRKCIE